ncbi:MAG: glycine cleavage system protein R [Solirubrobacteraceae bacterium]|jgi:glycine cleavage system transcriptional repressor
MRHFAVCVVGRDRPGIVAKVTRTLLEQDANVEDSQSTILRGHFAMTLIVGTGEDVDPARLRGELERAGADLRLEAVTLSEIHETGPAHPVEPSHIVTVKGIDHPGIVNAVASALADCDVNITDLNTRLVDEPDREDLYAMMLEVAVPEGLTAEGLEGLLEATRREQGVEVTIRELEHDAP